LTVSNLEGATEWVSVGGLIQKRGPFRTLGDFEGQFLCVYVTKPLCDQIAWIGLGINDYVVAAQKAENFVYQDIAPVDSWPAGLSAKAQAVSGVSVFSKLDPPLPYRNWQGWSLYFDSYTPLKTHRT